MNMNHAPYSITTDNVLVAVRQATIQFNIPSDKISFDIKKVSTMIKNKRTKEIIESLILSDRDLTDPDLAITQKYDLIMRGGENDLITFPNIVFANNSAHTTGYLVIKKNQDLKLSSLNREIFLNHLESILLLNKCLIRTNDNISLSKEVDELYKNYEEGEIISEEIKIKAIDFPAPRKPMPDSLEMVYKTNTKVDDSEDGGNKVKLASAKKHSTIIKYHKVVEGIIGRTYDGGVIKVGIMKPSHTPKFTIDSKTIEKKENDKFIDYIAKEAGFVFFERKFLRIDNKTEMSTANIRNKDKLVTSLDDGVSINIKSKDKLSDAVGGNINVKADKVNVNGNVGPSATVEGNIVKIGGQTHSKSKIIAKKAQIAVHKGELKGESVLIDILEGGTVFAKSIKVKTARGGRIEGENISIDNLEANVEIIASRKIEVKSIIGESNTFTLKPLGKSFGDKKGVSLEDMTHEKDVLEDTIKKEEKKLKEKMFLIKFNEESLNVQRDDKIDKLRYNIKSSRAMDNKLQALVKLQEEKDELENNVQKYKDKLEDIGQKIKAIYDDTESAFMEVGSMWTAGNSVYIHHDGKVHNFYPTKGTMKSPISFDALKKQNLIH